MVKLRAGSRGSKLALWQTRHVIERLQSIEPSVEVEVVVIKTKGDKIIDSPLSRIGGKGLFVKEIEEEMLRGNIDFAVHSLKDLPTELPQGLKVGAVLEREDPRDAFVSFKYRCLEDLPEGATVGTSSLRRKAQILARRPDLKVVEIRGNVDTRVRKIREGVADAAVMAYAGLKRMGLADAAQVVFDSSEFIPATGQGVIVVEVREDCQFGELLESLNHESTRQCIDAERAFLETIEGGCQVPAAAHAVQVDGRFLLTAFVADEDGSRMMYESVKGVDPVAVGVAAGKALLERGAGELIEEVRKRREKSTS